MYKSVYFGVVELSSLSMDYQGFADSLQNPHEREAFVRIRNSSRRLCRMGGRLAAYEALRKYYRCESRGWTILNDENGAPYLPNLFEVQLSITHSQHYAVAAVGVSVLGIDLEQIETRPNSLLRHFFSTSEQEWIRREGEMKSSERLHVLWSRKEAVSKLLKKGGYLPFKNIAVLKKDTLYQMESQILEDHVFSITWHKDGTGSNE